MDAVKILRDTSWSSGIGNLTVGSNYFFSYNGTTWVSTANNVYIDGIFERKFSLNNVYRDANDDIAVSGTLDSGTKKATVSVSWRGRTGTTTKSASFYLTDFFPIKFMNKKHKRFVASGNLDLCGDFGNGCRVCHRFNFGDDEVVFQC